MKKIRILIVDDSALVRNMLQHYLSQIPDFEVIGAASNAYVARDMIVSKSPDVLTLDVEMPRMDGVDFLRRLMPQKPTPTIVFSSLTQRGKQIAFDALEAGAVDYVPKPSSDLSHSLQDAMKELAAKVRIAASIKPSQLKRPDSGHKSFSKNPIPEKRSLAESTDKVIAIGASTGGTEAIKEILTQLPADTPGVVVVQHMPPGFTKQFSIRLNELSAMEVKEAENGDRILNGRVLIAPGGMQMEVKRSGGMYVVRCYEGEKVSGHCPSVDVLFHSVAREVGANALGVILTGMGGDGARGLKAMLQKKAVTIAQDQDTCVVFGMPKVAITMGAAQIIRPLQQIAPTILSKLNNGCIK